MVVMDVLISEDPKFKNRRITGSVSKKLFIGGTQGAQDEYEDFDEIIARYVQCVIANTEEVKKYKHYCEPADQTKNDDRHLIAEIQELCRRKKLQTPGTIPYSLTLSRKHPGT